MKLSIQYEEFVEKSLKENTNVLDPLISIIGEYSRRTATESPLEQYLFHLQSVTLNDVPSICGVFGQVQKSIDYAFTHGFENAFDKLINYRKEISEYYVVYIHKHSLASKLNEIHCIEYLKLKYANPFAFGGVEYLAKNYKTYDLKKPCMRFSPNTTLDGNMRYHSKYIDWEKSPKEIHESLSCGGIDKCKCGSLSWVYEYINDGYPLFAFTASIGIAMAGIAALLSYMECPDTAPQF